jgi:hypothetical protein
MLIGLFGRINGEQFLGAGKTGANARNQAPEQQGADLAVSHHS